MIEAQRTELISFSPTRKLARFDISTKAYLCSIGFEACRETFREDELTLDPAFLTVALAEMQPRPIASISEIRQVVEWSDDTAGTEYNGHEYVGVASLFPNVRVFTLEQSTFTWNAFFRACVDECDLASSWIQGDLASTLKSMCDLDQQGIPYKVLCRSIFDSDRSSFFLALYRCLEALYAHSSAQCLVSDLKLKIHWSDVAAALERELGWYPREEVSLTRILKFAVANDLSSILISLGSVTTTEDIVNLAAQASKAIYGLRNSIVHYRSAQLTLDTDSFDWPLICKAMVGIVVDVYEVVFAGQAVTALQKSQQHCKEPAVRRSRSI